jgi:prepilin-type N-terminal cleavage/methylation domain-containing protein
MVLKGGGVVIRLSAIGITKRSFTLIELICVMAISTLLIGLVVGRIGKIPAYLSFRNSLERIETVLNEAANQSKLTGNKIVILYKNNKFYPEDMSIRKIKYLNYEIPNFLEIEFDDSRPDAERFTFFSDGSASGPAMRVIYSGHIATIKTSKLTGMPVVIIND